MSIDTFCSKLTSTFPVWSEFSAETCCANVTPNRQIWKPLHIDIIILWNIFQRWFQIGQTMVLHTLKGLLIFEIFDVKLVKA